MRLLGLLFWTSILSAETWNFHAQNPPQKNSSNLHLSEDLLIEQEAENPLNLSGGIVAGGKSLTKKGAGEVVFSGTVPNFGLTVSVEKGTLTLNKTPGVDAINAAHISGGTLRLGAAHQIREGSSANVTVAQGVFDLNGFSETIHTLVLDGGMVTTGGGALTVGEGSGVVSIKGGAKFLGSLTLSPQASSPAFSYIPQGNQMSMIEGGTLNLGSGIQEFTGTSGGLNVDVDISSAISSGSLTKKGTHILRFSGTHANTYTGMTSIEAGTLILNKQAGVIAIPGHAVIGTNAQVRCDSTNQFASSSQVTVNAGGSLDLNHNNQTIGLLSGAGIVNLGDATLMLGGNGTSNFLGTLSGSGGRVIKQGPGIVQLSGADSNTYTGLTTINAGTLELGKSGNKPALSGSILLPFAATLSTLAPKQMTQLATVTLDAPGALFKLNGHAQECGSLIFNAGHVAQEGAPLTLAGSGLALSMQGNTSLSGPVHFTAPTGGEIAFVGTQGSASLLGNVDLGNAARKFNIARGNSSVDMKVSGNVQGKSLKKEGEGFLELSGTNTLSGLTEAHAGKIVMNGAHTSTAGVLVHAPATLSGAGSVVGNVTLAGRLAPGNSIGTITLVGNHVFQAGSALEVELDPTTSDLVNILGTLVLEPGATLEVIPQPGIYPDQFSYLIVDTTGGSTGTFSSVMNTLPTFYSTVFYTPTQIFLNTSLLPFSTLNLDGNEESIAESLDALDPAPGSDLELILAELRMASADEVDDELEQLQPSQFTALALAQENAALDVSFALFERLYQVHDTCVKTCDYKNHVWLAPLGAFSSQHRKSHEPAFKTGTGGIILGIDGNPRDCLLLGGALAYTYSSLNWEHDKGDGAIQTGYTTLYAAGRTGNFYLQGALFGNYNHYRAKRHIQFQDPSIVVVNRNAKNTHDGFSFTGDFEGGYLWKVKSALLSPFVRLDYLYLHEKGFTEKGARSLNLHVKRKNSDLLRSELGFRGARCFSFAHNKVSPTFSVSYIRETRFQGRKIRARLKGAEEGFTVKGMNPSRSLAGTSFGLIFLIPDEDCTLSTTWDGEFSSRFYNHAFALTWLYKF